MLMFGDRMRIDPGEQVTRAEQIATRLRAEGVRGVVLGYVDTAGITRVKTVPVAHIEKFMTLGPDLVARIEEDEDFRNEHFSAFYADGLTGEQAEALREWCAGEGLETVPLAPTISFANWIFLGYFLTRLLEGHVLRFLY